MQTLHYFLIFSIFTISPQQQMSGRKKTHFQENHHFLSSISDMLFVTLDKEDSFCPQGAQSLKENQRNT